jgi:two-component system, NarL family, invasion response regulator UvrY
MIKVLITDDHPVVRHGIRQILEDNDRIGLVEEAGNGKELIQKLKEKEFDVILLDISLPGRSGLEMISEIKKIRKSAGIIMLSIHSEDIYALKAIKLGASGYLTKASAPEELLKAIIKVANGERYISASVADKLAENLISETDKPSLLTLSVRELQVLDLFAAGKTVVQIADELSLSPKTISTYRTRLLEKLNLHTTADLIRYSILEENKGKE